MARQWVKIDADLFGDERIIEVLTDEATEPDEAMRYATVLVFESAIMVARRFETDGVVTMSQLVHRGVTLPEHRIERAVERLIDVGLLEHGGHRGRARRDLVIPSWVKWQGSADDERRRRDDAAERQRRARARRSQAEDKPNTSASQAKDKPNTSASQGDHEHESTDAQEPDDVAYGDDVTRDGCDASRDKRREEEIRVEREERHAVTRPPEHLEEQDQRMVAERLFESFGWRVDIEECEQLAAWALSKGVPNDVLVKTAEVNPWPSDVRSELRDFAPRVVAPFTWDRDGEAIVAATVEAERVNNETSERVADVIAITRDRLAPTDEPNDIEKKRQLAREELARIGTEEDPW